MSTRELAKSLIDQVPENKLPYIIAYLQGAAIPDESETPNADTLEAFEELDNGGGHTYNGPVENLIGCCSTTRQIRSCICTAPAHTPICSAYKGNRKEAKT